MIELPAGRHHDFRQVAALALVEVLVGAGADVNPRDNLLGHTPLSDAKLDGDPRVVEVDMDLARLVGASRAADQERLDG